MPSAGPVLLVANHTTYTDPFWLGKAIPRRFIPMMTSVFYDLPGIKFLMKHVVEAIRVPAAVARRNAPEIDEASAILKQGGTVLIFPEGTLRRVEDPSTKLFGRGVAMLVQQNPTTTVIPVWIEGGWGAYFSYAGGPPGQNKTRDKNRDIHIAFGHPLEFSEAEIADQRILRRRLRSEVHACRNLLGLEIPNEKTPSALGKNEDESGAE
jgi:1-acyl-sn-glycerol-3-phosphate acyltransferase